MNQIKCHQSIIDHEIVKNDSSLSHAIWQIRQQSKIFRTNTNCLLMIAQ